MPLRCTPRCCNQPPYLTPPIKTCLPFTQTHRWLHQKLHEKNKGCIVPALPERSAVQKWQMSLQFIEQRRRALQARARACTPASLAATRCAPAMLGMRWLMIMHVAGRCACGVPGRELRLGKNAACALGRPRVREPDGLGTAP